MLCRPRPHPHTIQTRQRCVQLTMAPALSEEYPQAHPVIAERITDLQHMELQDEELLTFGKY